MITYFAIAIPTAAILVYGLHLLLSRRGIQLSFLSLAGLAHVLIGAPILPTLLIYAGAAFVGTGIVFFLLGRLSIPRPIPQILAVLPVVILAGISWYASPSQNVFLIPEGYTGRVVIVHGCRDGAEREFDGMKRIYRIPAGGVLKTRFSLAGNSFDGLNSWFYYVTPDGRRTELRNHPASPNEAAVQGIWTLPHQARGNQIIDFIVEKGLVKDPGTYAAAAAERFQREIDSCQS